jgi:hypothetical protein
MFSEGLIYDQDTSKNGGDYKARLARNGIGLYSHVPQTCLNAKAGMIARTQPSYYYSDKNHNVGMMAFDWYPFQCGFNTTLPPNSPSCTDSGENAWAENALMSASSNHPGGVQVAWLDASGCFISETIETKNLNQASTSREYPADSSGVQFSYGLWSELGSINGRENASAP